MTDKKCGKCKKKIGFFTGHKECSHPDCNVMECDDCEGKVLKDCTACEELFCAKHVKNHSCESVEEDTEESEDESEDSEEESEENDDETTATVRINFNSDDNSSSEVFSYNDKGDELTNKEARKIFEELKKLFKAEEKTFEYEDTLYNKENIKNIVLNLEDE